ncbi:MAG: hypothetical protein JWP97_1717 [Labilithrix sp.]|nr:hypothetical protein [Labilithrix sp.]
MASKHDAKRARESFFQMQDNLARQKGQQFWMQKPKQPSIAPKAGAKRAAPVPPAPPADASASDTDTASPATTPDSTPRPPTQ